jgi:hypothetical protein
MAKMNFSKAVVPFQSVLIQPEVRSRIEIAEELREKW